MNKLNKIGLSALCGSLACVASANAGEISVSGSTQATWVSNEGSTTGNPLGLNTGLTFSGSGELDGGQKVALTITHADKNAFSAASMSLTTNNFGQIRVALADGGSGIDAYDDKMPTAWEETWGAGLGTGIDLISGVCIYKHPIQDSYNCRNNFIIRLGWRERWPADWGQSFWWKWTKQVPTWA